MTHKPSSTMQMIASVVFIIAAGFLAFGFGPPQTTLGWVARIVLIALIPFHLWKIWKHLKGPGL